MPRPKSKQPTSQPATSKPVTYGTLDKYLVRLGFAKVTPKGTHRI